MTNQDRPTPGTLHWLISEETEHSWRYGCTLPFGAILIQGGEFCLYFVSDTRIPYRRF